MLQDAVIIPSCTSRGTTPRRLRGGPASVCPTEAEWELAARGGLDRRPTSGATTRRALAACGRPTSGRAIFPVTTWPRTDLRGLRPFARLRPMTLASTTPPATSGSGAATGTTASLYARRAQPTVVTDPDGPTATNNPTQPYQLQRVQRGGSFLCSDSYCTRYRPSARHGCSPDTGMSHVGFRCVKSNRPSVDRSQHNRLYSDLGAPR